MKPPAPAASNPAAERFAAVARAVAATPEAQAVARASGGHLGTWTAEDEAALREGFLRIYNPHTHRWERHALRLSTPTPTEP